MEETIWFETISFVCSNQKSDICVKTFALIGNTFIHDYIECRNPVCCDNEQRFVKIIDISYFASDFIQFKPGN